ncbi:MAG: type II secretion system protein GspN [Desulfobacteraceae bacterium]|nr:type II secretion system protein GspN [Desulfobacteraceae bacterium]
MTFKNYYQTLKKNFTRKNIYYGLYGFVALIFFLWVLFPSEYIVAFLRSNIQQSGYGVTFTVKEASPTLFPIGIKMKGVSIDIPGSPKLNADYLKLSYGLFLFIGKNYTVSFSSGIFGGKVSGKVRFSNEKPGEMVIEKVKISNVDISTLKQQVDMYLPGYIIKGFLNVQASYSSDGRGNGGLSLSLRDFGIEKENLMFGMNSLNFQDISVKSDIKNKKLQIENCAINGKEFQGKIEGAMFIREPFGESTLRLSGMLKPDNAFIEKMKSVSPVAMLMGNNLSFNITGTLKSPVYSMN